MTLIECFTDSHIDNIAACLRLQPEKIILVGSREKMDIPAQRYRALLSKRGQPTDIVLCDIAGKDLKDIASAFDTLVKNEDACIIDLTGGDAHVVMAVGAVLTRLSPEKRKQVCVEIYDHTLGTARSCINTLCSLPWKKASLNVAELISLHGGKLHGSAYQPPASCRREALDRLWCISSADPKFWNRALMLLSEFESRSESKDEINLELERLRGSISNFHEKETVVRELLDRFQRNGIIHDRSSRYSLKYTYTSPLLRYCTLKAGNVLEVKTLLEGRAVTENGGPFFQDCRMSVSIDWDGILHHPAQRIPDTCNEIDVILMHGTTPLFISCKNGSIGEEELYKLHTVATRFGGPYAKKMLIATDLNQKSAASNRAFTQRAWDMDIFLVPDAGELSREEWQKALLQAVQ